MTIMGKGYQLHWMCGGCGMEYNELRKKVVPEVLVVVCRKCGQETRLLNGEKFRESFCESVMERVIQEQWAEVMGEERE